MVSSLSVWTMAANSRVNNRKNQNEPSKGIFTFLEMRPVANPAPPPYTHRRSTAASTSSTNAPGRSEQIEYIAHFANAFAAAPYPGRYLQTHNPANRRNFRHRWRDQFWIDGEFEADFDAHANATFALDETFGEATAARRRAWFDLVKHGSAAAAAPAAIKLVTVRRYFGQFLTNRLTKDYFQREADLGLGPDLSPFRLLVAAFEEFRLGNAPTGQGYLEGE